MGNDEYQHLDQKIDNIPARVMEQLKPYLDKIEEHDTVLYGANRDDGMVTEMANVSGAVRFLKGAGGVALSVIVTFVVLADIWLILEHSVPIQSLLH